MVKDQYLKNQWTVLKSVYLSGTSEDHLALTKGRAHGFASNILRIDCFV